MNISRAGTCLLLVLAAGALPAQARPDSSSKTDSAAKPLRPRTTYEDMQMFSQVLNQIRVNHPDSIDTHELLMAAVQGMVSAADPHSFVMRYTPMSAEKQQAYRDGKLYPVPIEFEFIEGAAIVVGAAPGSDAARQDILLGDELIGIDGKPVAAQSSLELEVTLFGPKNSTVRLTFERRRVDGSLVQLDRVVRRQRVEEEVSSVPVAFLLDPKTGYIRVTSFMGEKVADDLHDALGRLESQGAQRLVLDLRDNGGGRVDHAAHIAGEFLPKGTIVFTSEGRKREVTDTGRVKRSFWKSERRYPIVLMVNAGTASASELVAGALQDHDRALIVGRTTFGKALLMGAFPLQDGSMIELVIGHVRTPCGRVIQRQYHAYSRHAYYRLAGAERDTVGRPWCKTDGGRVVYGGGGIYPDIVFAERDLPPVWYARIREDELPLKWLGGYVSANSALFPSLDALAAHPRVPDDAVAQFRAFVEKNGIIVPPGTESDRLLQRMLTRGVARMKWGEEGYYRMAAILDPDVGLAVGAFDRAQAILGPAH
jgi:carboxyl-terminal processing protease